MRRVIWLLLFISGLSLLIVRGIKTVQLENRSREMLLTVQQALQNYHVDQERYIPRSELKGSELITVLSDFEFLPQLPINPWTGTQWQLDGIEPDFLSYQTDPKFETYSLMVKHPKSGEVIMELDSESNRSLESAKPKNQEQSMYKYTYADGSGNLYQIGKDTIKYEPVTPLQSSSGIYTGGEPLDITISEQQRKKLVELFDQAFTNKTFRVEKRTMGSGEIRQIPLDASDGATKKVIVAMRSPDKKAIESFLAELKNQ